MSESITPQKFANRSKIKNIIDRMIVCKNAANCFKKILVNKKSSPKVPRIGISPRIKEQKVDEFGTTPHDSIGSESNSHVNSSRLYHSARTYAITTGRSEEHTSELQSHRRTSYARVCLKNKLLSP